MRRAGGQPDLGGGDAPGQGQVGDRQGGGVAVGTGDPPDLGPGAAEALDDGLGDDCGATDQGQVGQAAVADQRAGGGGDLGGGGQEHRPALRRRQGGDRQRVGPPVGGGGGGAQGDVRRGRAGAVQDRARGQRRGGEAVGAGDARHLRDAQPADGLLDRGGQRAGPAQQDDLASAQAGQLPGDRGRQARAVGQQDRPLQGCGQRAAGQRVGVVVRTDDDRCGRTLREHRPGDGDGRRDPVGAGQAVDVSGGLRGGRADRREHQERGEGQQRGDGGAQDLRQGGGGTGGVHAYRVVRTAWIGQAPGGLYVMARWGDPPGLVQPAWASPLQIPRRASDRPGTRPHHRPSR